MSGEEFVKSTLSRKLVKKEKKNLAYNVEKPNYIIYILTYG